LSEVNAVVEQTEPVEIPPVEAEAVEQPTELTTEERLASEVEDLRAQVSELIADTEGFHSELVFREQERDASNAELASLREKVSALKADLSRDGSVFGLDFHFKTEGALYARETIEQRVRLAIERAGI
jgi:polyhydroxyalkanoate synthesis regulator phasin